jgi:hypothetical protein
VGFDEALGIETRSQDLPLLVCDQAITIPLIAENGTAPYEWTVSSGALPAGVTLSSSGILSGETTETGVFSFQARVEDATSASATRDLQILVENSGLPVLVNGSPLVCGELLQTLETFDSYHWLPGGETTPTISVAPLENTVYGLIVTDSFGCARRGSVLVPGNTSSPSCGAPTLESLNADSGPSSGGAEITLYGQNFQPGVTVRFAGVPATVVTSNSVQITVSVPSLSPGVSYDVTVRNPDGGTAGLPKAWLADFLDVPPTNLYYDPIVRLVRNGVSGGCGSGKYCPEDPVLRSQSAILLLKSSLGPLYAPKPATGFLFTDVPAGSFAADWIEDLARRGITMGCSTSPPMFCPGASVSRAQMAPLLLRTKLGADYSPPTATGSIFADVPADGFAAKWIEDLYNRHLTGGCAETPLRYCPDMIVSRGEFAAFLVRTFNLR